MAELIAACPGIDRASVYRTSELFEKLGILVRIPHGWKYRLELGEAFHEHHHHATCATCGASIALPEDPALETRLHELAARRHFTLTSHQIEHDLHFKRAGSFGPFRGKSISILSMHWCNKKVCEQCY